MKRPRYKLRTTLTAVAVVGLLLGLGARSERFRQRALFHRGRAYIGAVKKPCTFKGKAMAFYIPTKEGWWHYEMWYRMEDAAWHPWRLSDPEPVPPGGPSPKVAGFAE